MARKGERRAAITNFGNPVFTIVWARELYAAHAQCMAQNKWTRYHPASLSYEEDRLEGKGRFFHRVQLLPTSSKSFTTSIIRGTSRFLSSKNTYNFDIR